MENRDWSSLKAVFHEALELSPAERESFLAGQNDSVRAEVLRLLDSHERLEDFIEEPIAVEIGLDSGSYEGGKIGPYKIISLIGSGGMGRVFLAEKDGLEKKLALKIIKRGMDTDSILQRFELERRILSRLDNQYIARLIDAGSTESGLPFFVMEFIDGVPITRYCDENSLDIRERLVVFRKVCEAVQYAHQNLIVHRDIKPSNLLVMPDGTPKLLDFGIAKLINSDGIGDATTALQSRILTPEYASPEQLNGLPITTATDVYSLGVVLYELLSGARPFETRNKSRAEILNVVSTEEPVRPSLFAGPSDPQIVPGTSSNIGGPTNREFNRRPQTANRRFLKGDLDNIVLKALRKDSAERYGSAQAFSEDLNRFLLGLPVTATASSRLYRFSKFVARNRAWTAVGCIILMLSGLSVWQTIVARKERAQAIARFNEVRKLANSVLFDYQDGIRNLPGTAGVREKMVSDGAEYLDRLAAETPDDPSLQSELASAYDRLGDVKANFSTASVGNARVAREYYTRALNIKQKLMNANPDDVSMSEQIASSYDKLGDVEFGLGNRTEAVLFYKRAIDLREQILSVDDRIDVRFLLMKGIRNVAVRSRTATNTAENLALCQTALQMSEEFVRQAPDNAEYLEAYGDAIEGIAAILETSSQRRPEAVPAYERLISIRREHAMRFPERLSLQQKHGMSYSYLGDTFFELNNVEGAIPHYRQSLTLLDPLCAANSLNEPLIQDTANIRSSYAYSLALTGSTTESHSALTSVLAIFGEKFAKDETDSTTHFRIAMAKEGLGITYQNMARRIDTSDSSKRSSLELAISNFEESLAIYRVYQTGKEAFATVNVNAEDAVREVLASIESCRKELRELQSKSG